MKNEREEPAPPRPLPANSFGLPEALLGLALGYLVGIILISAVDAATRHGGHASVFGENVASLFGLWCGLVGAVVLGGASARGPGPRPPLLARLREDYGLAFAWRDLPLGIVIGVGAQYLLVPLLELPLLPFVPHLSQRLSQPAQQLTGGVGGAGLVLLGVLICCGSPFVEELFFRGLLMRALAGYARRRLSPRPAAVASVVASGILFGLVHFEPLELIALAGFGMVLGVLATWTRRLGPGMVAHAAFNAVTVISLVHAR